MVYGYVGHTRKLMRSRNIDSTFLLAVVSKLRLNDDKYFANLENMAVSFVRIGAFSPNRATAGRNPDPLNFTIGDLFEGIVLAPISAGYRFINLRSWRRTNIQERERSSQQSRCLPGQVQLGSDAVFRRPIRGPVTFPPYANQEDNVLT